MVPAVTNTKIPSFDSFSYLATHSMVIYNTAHWWHSCYHVVRCQENASIDYSVPSQLWKHWPKYWCHRKQIKLGFRQVLWSDFWTCSISKQKSNFRTSRHCSYRRVIRQRVLWVQRVLRGGWRIMPLMQCWRRQYVMPHNLWCVRTGKNELRHWKMTTF